MNGEYDMTQRAPLGWMLAALALVMLVMAWAINEPVAGWILAGTALVVGLFAGMFGWLRVVDEGEFLAVRFGPIPGFGKRIRYADVRAVRRSQSRLIDGWGVHFVPGRGWTYNLWGWDCAELEIGGRIHRIGSDDADALVEFLERKTARFVETDGAQPYS